VNVLDVVELIALGGLTVVKGLVMGGLAVVKDLVADLKTALASQAAAVGIVGGAAAFGGVLLSLFIYGMTLVFNNGRPPTLLDLITFVLAIPVTVLFRAVKGRAPKVDVSTATTSEDIQFIILVSQSCLTFFGGVVAAVADGLEAFGGGNFPILGKVLSYVGQSVAIICVLFGTVGLLDPSAFGKPWDWLALGLTLFNVFVARVPQAHAQSICGMLIALAQGMAYIGQQLWGSVKNVGVTVANVMSIVAGVLNPLKFAGHAGVVAVVVANISFATLAALVSLVANTLF
jgi:hypothetical protein